MDVSKLLLFMIQVLAAYCEQSEIDVDICVTQNKLRALRAYVKNPGFPNPVSSNKSCTCNIRSTSEMDIGLRYLLGDSNVLKINYIDHEENKSWRDMTFIDSSGLSENIGIAIARNITYAELLFKAFGDPPRKSFFQVNAQVSNGVGELSINCTTLPHDKTTINNNNNNNTDDSGFLSSVESICSSELIIILGSLCVFFLLVILSVSIALCCLVPKKKQKIMNVVRRSRLMTSMVRKKPKTMESRIYDEASFRISQGDYLEPVETSNTLPMSNNRATQQYANLPLQR